MAYCHGCADLEREVSRLREERSGILRRSHELDRDALDQRDKAEQRAEAAERERDYYKDVANWTIEKDQLENERDTARSQAARYREALEAIANDQSWRPPEDIARRALAHDKGGESDGG